ncbi:hypothetical protein LSTR_LSTR008139 [Laodelphax striatellus]|uniref:C3H1-type domain-containing protein n=1 Tax=Laodelphax striatellus TaxID=195883 RepID=A0A482WYX1_LAOST|nr:hypothetical protein LSTR_LSTR008139 [Laodelphax striatellus]
MERRPGRRKGTSSRCDADPAALAKYVYALIKKDKPIQELRESMTNQLEVFLQKETELFIDTLFKHKQLTTQQGTRELLPIEPSAIKVEIDSIEEKELSTEPLVSTSPTVDELENGENETSFEKEQGEGFESESEKERELREMRERQRDKESKSSSSERDDYFDRRSRVRRRSSSHQRMMSGRSSRSRSRSWEQRHSRRSRSRDRLERDRSRAWRNKSPPTRRYDRERRRWSKSPIRTKTIRSRSRSRSPRSRSRSPPSKRLVPRYRNRSPPSPCSRSRSPRELRHDLSDPGTPTQDSNHADQDLLGSIYEHRVSSHIQSAVDASKSNLPSKQRCRDFDEKGYCMRGEMCRYDHGADPVVVDDVQLPQMLSKYQTNTLPLASNKTGLLNEQLSLLPSDHHMGLPRHRTPELNVGGSPSEYNPDAPSIELKVWTRPPFRGVANTRGTMRSGGMRNAFHANAPPNAQQVGYMHQRELVSVPVGNQPQPYQPQPIVVNYVETSMSQNPNKRRGTYDYRGGPRRGFGGMKAGPQQSQDNCSLEIKKIPPSLNNITHLNNHFAKFGKIVNIQVSYEGDPEGALITFQNHGEAYSAYRSSEAVLNNRFIKVFWHNSEGKQENVPPRRPSVKERLGAAVNTSPTKVLNTLQPEAIQQSEETDTNPASLRKSTIKERLGALNITSPPPKLTESVEPTKQESTAPKTSDQVLYSGSNLTKTMYINNAANSNSTTWKAETIQVTAMVNPEKKQVVNQAAVKKSLEMQAVNIAIKKKREEIRKEALKHFRKRKQELLEKQIANQKLLVERLQKGYVVPEQRLELISTIKTLQENIEKTKKEIADDVDKMSEAKPKVTLDVVKKTKEEAQRKILDAELDIFNQQQEGKDTTMLQKKVLELKMQVKTLGLISEQPAVVPPPVTTFSTRGTNSYRARRGGRFVHTTVDHRTTKLLVSGFEIDDKEEVLAHFAQYGELLDCNFDETTPSLVVTYKSRKDAENVIKKGRNFGDRLLSVTWFNAQHNSMGRRMIKKENFSFTTRKKRKMKIKIVLGDDERRKHSATYCDLK